MDREDKYNKFIKLNVLELEELLKLGFNSKIYYCGNKSLEGIWTVLVFNYMKKEHGFLPIYNPACFKHDLLYGLKPSIKEKRRIDKVFINDMRELFLNHVRGNKDIKTTKAIWMWTRLNMYYWLVKLMTPIYILQGKIKKK